MNFERSTKGRLLRTACAVFAEKGYRDATVSEICDAAEANIASVNYYFGDKSNLYYECFLYLFDLCRKTYPHPDPQTTTPEQWLRGFVRARILNIFDEGEAGLLPKMIHHEMGQPTEVHSRLHDEVLCPNLQMITGQLQKFLGSGVTENELQIAKINLSSLHIFINVGKHHALHHREGDASHPCSMQVNMDREAIAEQVENYALGGLMATRELLQSRKVHS